MKLVLPDALHARPANLLVRVASRLTAVVWVHKGDARANAREILEILKLGAAKGDEILLASDHPESLAAIVELIERNFDADLVPETGAVAAAGIAIGEALVLVEEDELHATGERGSVEDETARAASAFARARSEVTAMVATLPKREAELFEPELAILDALEPKVLERIAEGEGPEEAVRAEAVTGHFDLIDDARARLIDALKGTSGAIAKKLAERTVDVVLVTTAVTPSLVASLPPHVVGVIAGVDDEGSPSTGTTSHAAILARGRALPLAYVPSHVAYAIEDAVHVVLDTTSAPARVWAAPSEALLAEARARRDALRAQALDEGQRAEAALPLVAVRVNVGSSRDEIPRGAEGIGLLRTELLFADRIAAPREEEQSAAYAAIAKKVTGPVLIRLFDAGGDKPLPFLPGDLRGIALLRANPSVLETQLRAIARVPLTTGSDARVLIPLVRDADDVESVRRLAGGRKVGAMIETPEAALGIDDIARVSDFVCIGTNDLAAETLGLSREQAPNPLDPRVLAHVRRTVEGAKAHGRKVTVCGEIAADPRGARILVGLGVDALSVAPARFASLKLSLRNATIDECRAAAERALKANAP